jgi:hypothetical protein
VIVEPEWNEAAAAESVARMGPDAVAIIRQMVQEIRATILRRVAKGKSPMPAWRSGAKARMGRGRRAVAR